MRAAGVETSLRYSDPRFYRARAGGPHPRGIPLHTPEAFECMRQAGRIAAEALDYITPLVVPGIATERLDDLLREFMMDLGAVPATIGYRGYRHSSCISVNHVATHGIPGPKTLQEGDILNIDVTPKVQGWHGDTSRMYTAGPVGVKAQKLIDTTFEAMWAAIRMVRPGVTTGELGAAQEAVALANRCTVVTDFCGHGVGEVFHAAPEVPFHGRHGTGVMLEPGMFFTIEPMVNAGRPEIKILPDGWTTVTRDRSLSAQFEHTVGVTDDGVEIFTLSPTGLDKPEWR